jgi:hypothetical protein
MEVYERLPDIERQQRSGPSCYEDGLSRFVLTCKRTLFFWEYNKMKVSFKATADGGAMNFDIGFIPDEIFAIRDLDGDTNEIYYRFFRVLADTEDDGQYGFVNIQTGDKSACADAANGFIPYDEGDDSHVLITHPGSGKKDIVTVADWASGTDYSSGARSATAIGTIVRPPTHNGRVFELTTATGNGTSEPSSWDVQPGETVTDGGSNVWTCRAEDTFKGGGQGFTVGATLSTDGEEWLFVCEQHDRYEDLGDVDGLDPIRFASNRR